MELHLVHTGAENPEKIAVLGVFLEFGGDGKALREECNKIECVYEPSKLSCHSTTFSVVFLSYFYLLTYNFD